VNHSTQSIPTLDPSAAPIGNGSTHGLGRREAQGAVGTVGVVVINEDRQHVLEMLTVEDQEPIETLRANGPYEPLRHPVRLRRAKGRTNDLDPVTSKDRVKTVRELLVPIANQEANRFRPLRQPPRQLPSLLSDPWPARIWCASGQMDPAVAQLDEVQHIE
jgi:hypothetical protein